MDDPYSWSSQQMFNFKFKLYYIVVVPITIYNYKYMNIQWFG